MRRTSATVAGLLCVVLSSFLRADDTAWVDIASPLLLRLTNNGGKMAWPGGCSGVVVNCTNGEVTIRVVGQGCGAVPTRVPTGGGWMAAPSPAAMRPAGGTSTDVDDPGRIASFSLDGTGGWTTDGVHRRGFADLGRNWDFGSVDWSEAGPRTLIGARYETAPPGETYMTRDGGQSWTLLTVHLDGDRNRVSMVGAVGRGALVYCNDDGIHRSPDAGATWTRLSTANPRTPVPGLFRGANSLGGTNGLLISRDHGATWKGQGGAVDIRQGPHFGRDETEMLVVGKDGVFVTKDSCGTWTRVAALKLKDGGFLFTANWFGCYALDPVNNHLSASAMGNPLYRLKL